jgi:putative ABC transport system ATP-binding protein
MESAIVCKNLTKSYGTKGNLTPALRGIDLEVKPGELFMLVGPSGCGKTTLISVIAGILNHDEGSCRIFSHDLDAMEDGDRTSFRGRNVGFVFQAYNLIPTLTTTENASIPLILNGVPRAEANERSREMLRQVGLGSKLDALPTELSGGQQQRVAIARALVHNPRLIVCDEPTSALDHTTGAEIMELFRHEALKGGRTLVIVTHDARIFQYADRIGVMDDGRITRIVNSPSEL